MNQTRHVAITGAAGGLGHALATTLSNQGCRLSLSDVVANEGTDRKIAVVDVRDAAAMTDWLTACHDEQPIDWLIVNAALGGPAPIGEPFESEARAAELLAVNALAAIEQCRVATRLMAGRGGRIILVASLAAVLGNPNAPVYAATKGAVRMLGHSLAARLHGTAIEVTIALPGFISEGMGGKDGWRPFAVTPMTAAERIVRAAERGRLEVSFPAAMVWLLRGLRLLPPRLRFAAYQKMSGS